MTQIEKNRAELRADIWELANSPLTAARASQLTDSMAAYDALCRADMFHSAGDMPAACEDDAEPSFNRQMAEEWTAHMQNADGTRGPHFTMEKAREIQRQFCVDGDPVLFWAVINSLYSDYDEALKENNTSTVEMYACLAKAWINDADAVPNKAAAYYAYVVRH